MTDHLLLNQLQLVLPPTGMSKLPLVEVKRKKVLQKYKSILITERERKKEGNCSYGPFGDEPLEFSTWELSHAAKKTELTRSFSVQRSELLGHLFVLEHYERFIWDTDNLLFQPPI